ncbi:UNVERIFIED_CONTAM: hypothetical protein FKN15_054985 [Acipenser sinensis]
MSSLVITETTAHDFSVQYNCSAWNRFGEGVALLTLQEQEVLPLMIIVGAAAGGGAILLTCIIVIILLCCRNSGKAKKSTRLSKSDIRVQIVHSDHNAARTNEDEEEDVKEPMAPNSESPGTSRTEHSDLLEEEEDERAELKDPTNGYYNVRTHEDLHIRSSFSDYVPNPRPIYTPSSQLPHSPLYSQPPSQPRIYDYRHRYGTATRGRTAYEQQQYPQEPVYGGSAHLPAPYGRAFTSYVKPATYEKVDSYDPSDQASKVSSSSRFSYASSQVSSHQSDFGQPTQQRMQTHV